MHNLEKNFIAKSINTVDKSQSRYYNLNQNIAISIICKDTGVKDGRISECAGRNKLSKNYNANGIVRATQILIAVIMGITGVTSLVAWKSKGFTDWNVPGWFGYVAEETPSAPPAEESAYKFIASRSARSASPLAFSSEAEAEYEEILSKNSGIDLTNAAYLEKISVKNNVNGQTLSAADVGIKVAVMKLTIMDMTAVVVPRINPFADLQTAYVYEESYYYMNSNPDSVKSSMHKNLSDSYDVITISNGELSTTQFKPLTVLYDLQPDPNAVLPLPDDPEKEGYTFAGWYYGTEAEHGDGCTQYTSDVVTSDINLHAHFDINRYTVTYDVAGGKEIQNQVVDWNTELTPPTPERVGYDFTGWYLSDGTEYTGQPIKEDTTLTARWQIKTFTVTFYVGGEVYATKTVNYGTTFAELAEEAKDLKLKVLTVMTEQGEQTLEELAQSPITEDYTVKSINLTTGEFIQHVVQKYPWIFVAAGGGLSLIVGLCGYVRYRKATKPVVNKLGKNRRK